MQVASLMVKHQTCAVTKSQMNITLDGFLQFWIIPAFAYNLWLVENLIFAKNFVLTSGVQKSQPYANEHELVSWGGATTFDQMTLSIMTLC